MRHVFNWGTLKEINKKITLKRNIMKKRILLNLLLLGSIALVAGDHLPQRANNIQQRAGNRLLEPEFRESIETIRQVIETRINSQISDTKRTGFRVILADLQGFLDRGYMTTQDANRIIERATKNECASCLPFCSYARKFIQATSMMCLANYLFQTAVDSIDLPSPVEISQVDYCSQISPDVTTEITKIVPKSIRDRVVGHLTTLPKETVEQNTELAALIKLPGVHVLGVDSEGNPVLSLHFDKNDPVHMEIARQLIGEGIFKNNHKDNKEENDSALVEAVIVDAAENFDKDTVEGFNYCSVVDGQVTCSYKDRYREQEDFAECQLTNKDEFTRCVVQGDSIVCS